MLYLKKIKNFLGKYLFLYKKQIILKKYNFIKYIKIHFIKLYFLKKNKSINYFINFQTKALLFTFINFYKKIFIKKTYFIKIIIKTYFYKIFASKTNLYLHMRSNHLYNLLIPKNIFLYTKKRKIIFFSLNKKELYNIIKKLLKYKPHNNYTLKGLHLKKNIIKKKKGKIR